MEDEDKYDKEFEELVLINIISEYIDKYMIKVLCRLLRLMGELWIQDVLNSHSLNVIKNNFVWQRLSFYY